MRKVAIVASIATGMLALPVMAQADHPGNFNQANNATQCAAAGGVFTDGGPQGTNTCVVTDTSVVPFGPVAGGSNNWTVSGTTTTTTTDTYTKGQGPGAHQGPNVVVGPQVVTACFNPGGHSQDLTHQHCVVG